MGKEKGEKTTSGTSGRRPGRGRGEGGTVYTCPSLLLFNAFGKGDGEFAKESVGMVMSVTFVAA